VDELILTYPPKSSTLHLFHPPLRTSPQQNHGADRHYKILASTKDISADHRNKIMALTDEDISTNHRNKIMPSTEDISANHRNKIVMASTEDITADHVLHA
jgi:hypothetical protein